MIDSSWAFATAAVRVETPSLEYTERRWACTVRGLTTRRLAMSAFVRPSATSRRTSRSRRVRVAAAGRFRDVDELQDHPLDLERGLLRRHPLAGLVLPGPLRTGQLASRRAVALLVVVVAVPEVPATELVVPACERAETAV